MREYVPVLIFTAAAISFAVITIAASSLIVPRRMNATKLSPYECGVEPVGSARARFEIKFYLVAVLFILFDIEAVFLSPVGGGVPPARALRLDRDGAVHPRPPRRLRLSAEEARAGMGMTAGGIGRPEGRA